MRLQVGLEEGDDRGIELGVEGGAVETRGITADIRHERRECARAGREECEVAGVRHDVVFGLDRQGS